MNKQISLLDDSFDGSDLAKEAAQSDDIDQPESQVSYRLHTLEVFNWGPFCGLHRIEFDEAATAIIGPTGSGKTTLVDALMTLLVVQPRYNLASTGGVESDRDLMSYVRGVLGGDGSEGREQVSRPGKTITGISATYLSGDQTLRLGSLLWIDGTSNAAADLKRRWIFSTAADQSLETWLRTLHDDSVRELTKLGRQVAGLRIWESKTQYLVHTRKFFDVGDNAFTLLNRAAGLKQLHSIDDIFRELVLDDRSAFDRALEVSAEFDNLAAIHTELQVARKQRDALLPVDHEEQQRLKLARKTDQLKALRRIVPTWFAMLGCRLWKVRLAQLEAEKAECERSLEHEKKAEDNCRIRVDQFRELYHGLGGALVAQLEETIRLQQGIVDARRKHALNYQRMIGSFDLNVELTAEALRENQTRLRESNEQLSVQRESQQTETLVTMSKAQTLKNELVDITENLRKVKDRPGSNIPPQFQDFRNELARHLSLREEELPYLAEMVEVQADESDWRGAIERALGSERLRVLVPNELLRDALRWVNDRDNRIHVRLQSAKPSASSGDFFSDSFARKLNFRQHPLRAAAEHLIASRDLHCVSSAKELERVEHGLTIQGMTSGRRGRFEKQDQRRLSDGWLTGFDNKAQLHSLLAQHEETEALLQSTNLQATKQRNRLNELDKQALAIEQLLSLEFETIDLSGAVAELSNLQVRLSALLDPDSDASRAKAKFDSENALLSTLRQATNDRHVEIGVLDSEIRKCQSRLTEASESVGSGLTKEEQDLAGKNVKLPDSLLAQQLDNEEKRYLKLVNEETAKHTERVADQEKRMIRCMEAAKRTDTGELADIGSELEDVPYYLKRLAVLQREALPEKLSRFLEYLNRSSDQGVTQLLAGIEEQVDAIEYRITELNRTLLKVDFRSDRYLQLQPQRLQDERKRALDAAMRALRSASLKDDQGESHYKALRDMVNILRDAADNRRQVGSRALLDPRYRLNFFVVEVDRKSGNTSPRRTGSQSGSGGEKELMASHILTASLSYALCPAEATRPLYASVILDEAFSKSSPSAATRIIEALRIFGLHPIFVTPNKEIGLLKRHTRKVICVQRIGGQSSVASIRWEELEAMAPKTTTSQSMNT